MAIIPPADRGPGWEYLYFASEFARGLAAHQPEYLAYQSQVGTPGGPAVADPAAYLQRLSDEIREAVGQVDALLSPSVFERAFGSPGQPVDEAAIRSVAGRLTDAYSEMISWGLRVRHAVVAPEWQPVYAALAKFVSLPLHQFQDFSAALSDRVSSVVAAVRAGIPQSEPLELTLTVSIDPSAVSEFEAALAALTGSTTSPAPASPPSTSAQPSRNADPVWEEYAPVPPYVRAVAMPTGSALERAMQLPRYVWFRRFGDIPGVDYQTPVGIDPTKLPGHGLAPRRYSSDVGGQHLEDLVWPTQNGSSSASPAHDWGFGSGSGEAVAAVVEWCAQGLELPGEPSDYHFIIQSAIGSLHKLCRRDHCAFAELERLCLLDVALVEAWPRAVVAEYSDEPHFYAVSAFEHLISLHETEGALHEAMEMARRAASFSPGWDKKNTGQNGLAQAHDKREELAQRIAAIDSETMG